MSIRQDKCKCEKILEWDTVDFTVKCFDCGTEYTVQSKSTMVYWLEEVIKVIPYSTEAR